jgi:hypothetical protein
MTTPGGPPDGAVHALNSFLAARSWNEARPWLEPGSPCVSRWAAHRCLLGASGSHGEGQAAHRDVYAWSAMAIMCALDAGESFHDAVWEDIGAWWSWTCHRREPQPRPFAMQSYLRTELPQEDLRSLLRCANDTEADVLLASLPSLWNLAAAAAVTVAGFDSARAGTPAAGMIFLFAAMIIERVPPLADDDLPVTALYEDAPELRRLIDRAEEAKQAAGHSYMSVVEAVRAWAEVFAHPDSLSMTSGARAACLAEAADAVLSLYDMASVPAACDWTLKLAELALAVPDFPPNARHITGTRRCRALSARYDRLTDDGDLRDVIAAYEQMVADAPDAVDQRVAKINLALALRSRGIAHASSRSADFARATGLLEADARKILDGSSRVLDPDHDPALLTNYSLLLSTRFSMLPDRPETERVAELHTAIEAGQKAVAAYREADRNPWAALQVLAEACFELNGIRPHEQDWPSVSKLYAQARQDAVKLGPRPDLAVSHLWGRAAAARTDWATADRAFGYAIRAFDAVLKSQPVSVVRTQAFSDAYGVAAEAALVKIMLADKTGKPDLLREAVGILERLRAVQLSLAMTSPTGHPPMRTADGHTAGKLARIARRNDDLERALAAQDDPARALGDLARLATSLKEYTDVASELLPAPLSPWHPVDDWRGDVARPSPAAHRTLVYIGAASASGFALLMRPNSPQVEAILLPGLTNDLVGEHAARYSLPAQPADRWQMALQEMCLWLWPSVMAPLLERVGSDLDAIWIVPTWVLGTFPLHAAREQPWDTQSAPDVLDRLAISYMPAARMLRPAQEGAHPTPDPRRLVILVAPGLATSAKRSEALVVAAAWPGAAEPRPAQETTRSLVLDAFSHAEVLHLICHGEANPEHPLRSVLYLADNETISLQDLLEARSSLRLAVLAACDTAVIGHGDYDEALGLPGTLLAAGCQGVVSALWQVPDQSSAVLFARFYEIWPTVHDHPAQALRSAQRWLRHATSGEISERYPTLYPPPARSLPQVRLKRWRTTKPFANPDHWAGFVYTGS